MTQIMTVPLGTPYP